MDWEIGGEIYGIRQWRVAGLSLENNRKIDWNDNGKVWIWVFLGNTSS